MRNEVYKGRRGHSAKGLMTMLVALALTAGACSDNATEDALAHGTIRVTAEAALKDGSAQTRTDYTEVTDGGMTVAWTTGDAFMVFKEGSKQGSFTLKKTDADGKGHFEGTLTANEGTTTLYALYPAAVASSAATASLISLNVASQTQAASGSMAHLATMDFMRASAPWDGKTGSVAFGTFAHLMAVLRLDIELPAAENVISSIVLSGLNAGQTLDLTKDPAKEMEGVWNNGKSTDITLTTTNGTTTAEKKYTAYLMVFPTAALKNLTVTINLAGEEGGSYEKKFTSTTGMTLAAANRYWIAVKDLSKVGGGSDSEDMGGSGTTGGAGGFD